MQNGREDAVFEFPQEVLAILPSDPYEQLDVACTITAMAVAARVSKLELETGNLHLKLAEKEKEKIIHVLQERTGDPESTLHQTSARLWRALGEHVWKLLLDVSRLSKGF
ncbi:unnamed protein product [Sphagnum balticum]